MTTEHDNLPALPESLLSNLADYRTGWSDGGEMERCIKDYGQACYAAAIAAQGGQAARQAKPLSDWSIKDMWFQYGRPLEFARAIEQAHGIVAQEKQT